MEGEHGRQPPRILALDVSPARIGLAVNHGRLAFPRETLLRSRLAEDLVAVAAAAAREGADFLVIGLPLRTDGKPSVQAQRVRSLGYALQRAGLQVTYQDERFTTSGARQDLAGLGRKGKRETPGLDSQSAVRILELYLEQA